MQHDDKQEPNDATFRRLYPILSDQELKEAKKTFTRYFAIALEIYRELHAASEAVDSSPTDCIIKERSKKTSAN